VKLRINCVFNALSASSISCSLTILWIFQGRVVILREVCIECGRALTVDLGYRTSVPRRSPMPNQRFEGNSGLPRYARGLHGNEDWIASHERAELY
jgi:hypothetical protein